MNNNLLNHNGWSLLLTLSVLLVLLTYAINFLFLTEGLYYQSFGEQLAIKRIDKILELSQKWQWLGYVFIPVIVLFRISYTSVFLYIGVFFSDLKVEFGRIIKVAIFANLVFVFYQIGEPIIIKIKSVVNRNCNGSNYYIWRRFI